MDTAKGCNFLLTNGGRMEDYWGVGKATRPMLPLIAIPTTAGTGSECQSFALITHPQTHVKMACGDPKAAARVAILDPELTLTQPPAVAARHRHGRPLARRGNGRHAAAEPDLADALPRGVSPLRARRCKRASFEHPARI